MLRGQVFQEFLPGLDGVHFVDQGLERRGAVGVETGGVHHHIVEVADFLGDGSLLVVAGGNLLDQRGEGLDIVIHNLVDRAPKGIFHRLGIVVSPMTGGVASEIIARTRGRIHISVIDTGGLDRSSGVASGQKHCRCSQEIQSFFHN